MGAIPHSGNLCSGLCSERPAPCAHLDCWQCADLNRGVVEKQIRDQMAKYKVPQSPLIAALGVNKDEMKETTTITRVALEALCERAALTCHWNDGNPIIREKDGTGGVELAPKTLTATVTAEQVAAAAESVIKGASTNEAVEALKAEVREDMNAKARELLRQQGVSDADIVAAEKLLGPLDKAGIAKPGEPKAKAKAGLQYAGVWLDEAGATLSADMLRSFDQTVTDLVNKKLRASLISSSRAMEEPTAASMEEPTAASLRRQMETFKANGVKAAIVHPSLYDRIKDALD